MTVTAGLDVGSSSIKAVILAGGPESPRVLAHARRRIRRRDISDVVAEAFGEVCQSSGVGRIDYIATTGEGWDIPFATGHFYGMTTHARGALFLEPRARSVLDIGALHGRAVSMDGRGKVLDCRMTSQCASGSGQFLESISRYLGVSQSEAGLLSLQATAPEKPSSICAVLAETDVINMVSRGVATADILRGIHDSMAVRFAQLLHSLGVSGTTLLSGGLAADVGLAAAIASELKKDSRSATRPIELIAHPLSIYAGALGAALWGAVRHAKVGGVAWTANGKA